MESENWIAALGFRSNVSKATFADMAELPETV